MVRPLGSLLLSLPVALVLAVPAAEAESSAATRNSSFELFGLFQNDDASRGDVRQVQAQVQPSMGGSGQVQSEGLPPPGLAPQDMPASNGLPPAGGNANGPAPIGNQFGHQFGNQPAVQNDPNAIAVARPPAPLGSRSAAPGPVSNESVMALPPDDQPEQGQPKELAPNLTRQLVDYTTKAPAGTIIVDTSNTYLYLVLGGGK